MSEPIDRWRGDFGDAYIERNEAGEAQILATARGLAQILSHMHPQPRSILEVGANVGINLRALRLITDAALTAVEPNGRAREILVRDGIVPPDKAVDADAANLPFDTQRFDLVLTRGVLIHIPDSVIDDAYAEIYRVSARFLLSIEYFAPVATAIDYRGYGDMLFKRDYGAMWLDRFPTLRYIADGFLWHRTTGFDDVNWWLFEKSQDGS